MTGGGFSMQATTSGSNAILAYTQTGTQITVCYRIFARGGRQLNNSIGICLFDGTKYVVFAVFGDGAGYYKFVSNKWTNYTTYSGAYAGVQVPVGIEATINGGAPIWLRIRNSAGNRISEWSTDGVTWTQVDSQVATDFLTPTSAGVYIDPAYVGAATIVEAQVLSMVVAA